jgi:hypothetical protein
MPRRKICKGLWLLPVKSTAKHSKVRDTLAKVVNFISVNSRQGYVAFGDPEEKL